MLELLDGARTPCDAAVADEADGLVSPFLGEVIDGVLESRVVAEVVLGCHENERVDALDDPAPLHRVAVDVLVEPRMFRFVEEG